MILLGLRLRKRHHFHDRGAGEEDHGQYDETLQDVFGISGATFLIRTSIIPSLHGNDWQIFDERMWMYKEDIDLSYPFALDGSWAQNPFGCLGLACKNGFEYGGAVYA